MNGCSACFDKVTRAMAAEYRRLVEAGFPEDDATITRIAELAGVLALAVPYLLDEIDRLRAEASAERERVRVLKMDRTGGSA